MNVSARMYRWNKFFMNADISLVTLEEATQSLARNFCNSKSDSPTTVAFINAHNANCAYISEDYQKALCSFSKIFPDGIAIRLSSYLFGVHPIFNIPGTDLVPKLLTMPELAGTRIFLLGDHPDFIRKASMKFSNLFPNVFLVGYHHGFFDLSENERIVHLINSLQTEVLLIAMSTPIQEIWLSNNSQYIDARLQISVGGLFQYWDGRLIRAPKIAQRLGLEWAWILVQQPSYRWKRYFFGIPSFLYRAITHLL